MAWLKVLLQLCLYFIAMKSVAPLKRHRQRSYADDVVVSGYSEVAAAPYFLSPGPRNITTAQSHTAYLHCRVASLGDEAQVSWIRKRDLHVLSSGRVVFATDERFGVIHTDDKSENWTLQIKFTQLRDSGIYECQVNTVPKISMAYQLNVVESEAIIQGPEYVKAGSTINLTCTVNLPDMQGLLFWYHDSEILSYEDHGRVKIYTKEDASGRTVSQLTIEGAQLSHSGNYTCWPTSAIPKSVIVNVVLQGEQPAAMQTGVATILNSTKFSSLFSSVFVMMASAGITAILAALADCGTRFGLNPNSQR
ncbi:uncharacterized protein LOC108675217 [Hyalella azteca]|uniref:Uncharacterized protein LOC108675217 n=1 Tax=Hyalella azteca TaxID=294128 RepID=A0A979FRX5_HYAAZ|nr:uncharacterized protein LOC108675217 [Hyalella azteca]